MVSLNLESCLLASPMPQLRFRVLIGLNPEKGQAFVSVYIDDILIYSRTLEEHLCHVLERIQKAGLKLKVSKCAFVRQEVEYLGHIITPVEEDRFQTRPIRGRLPYSQESEGSSTIPWPLLVL